MSTRSLSIALVVLSGVITGIGSPGARAAIHALVPQDGTLLTLRLQAAPHAPADLPPGVLTLRAPLYPHARLWRHRYAMPMFISITPYVKESPQVTYQLPTDPEKATAWYLDAFSRHGYTVQQLGGGGSFTGVGSSWTLLDFRTRAMPSLDLFVALQERPGGSIVAYRASAVIVPRRVPGSYLSEGVSRVTVTIQFLTGLAHQRTIARTLTKHSAIITLVRAINALPRSTGGFLSCPQIDRQATLVFVSPGGRVTVRTDPGCTGVVIAGYPPLAGSIWPLLSALLPPRRS